MDFYTCVIRKSGNYWVALCLENGLVGQGDSKEQAIDKLKEAIASFKEVSQEEADVYSSPVSINELHEFLTIEGLEPQYESYELKAVHA